MSATRWSWALSSVCVVFLLLGCTYGGSKGAGSSPGSGAYIAQKSDLKPDANPGDQAQLILEGVIIPVQMKAVPKGGQFALDLFYNDQLFEEELYASSEKGMSLVNAAGETYIPPIPLIKFPMHIGDTWTWKGKMMTGPAGREAAATIRTLDGKVDTASGREDALVVEVDLEMFSGAKEAALRRLAFWFVKDKGLLKREFGASTSRVPAGITVEMPKKKSS